MSSVHVIVTGGFDPIHSGHLAYFESAKKQAWDRFDLDPLPIGIPEEHEPPQTHSFEWENMPVSLKVEQKLAKIVVRKGEFGWLEDERVQEIGEIVDDLDMTLDQALSLRSALLQDDGTVDWQRKCEEKVLKGKLKRDAKRAKKKGGVKGALPKQGTEPEPGSGQDPCRNRESKPRREDWGACHSLGKKEKGG